MKNYEAEVCRHQLRPKAEIDNDKLRLRNSSYHVTSEFNNCFIIYLKEWKKIPVVEHICMRKAFVLFHIPAHSEVDVVVIGMTS